jgi:hypothetical protein
MPDAAVDTLDKPCATDSSPDLNPMFGSNTSRDNGAVVAVLDDKDIAILI